MGSGGTVGAAGNTGVAGATGSAGTTGAAGATAGTTGTAGSTGVGGGGGGSAGSAGRGGTGGRGGGGAAGSGTAGASGTTGAGGSSAAGTSGSCPAVDFGTWPTGKDPSTIGKLAVTNFKPHTGDAYSGAGYAWTFAYVGSLQFTQLTGDTTNNDYLVSHFDCTQAGPDNSSTATVDTRAFGDLPLEIFVEKGTAACKTLGMARADAQWANTADTAITPDARYWSDDMFMITGLQDFGYRATKTEKYLDRTALTMASYIMSLQQSDGLMWHTKMTMAKWGRANGWFAAGMALLLQDLPSTNTNRAAIMTAYKKMMDGLLTVQITSGADAGGWRQVLDRTDATVEMSCTAMFTYALVTGLKNGWLSGAQYVTAAKNGWNALGVKTDSTGQLSKVCPGTGQASGSAGVGTDLTSQQNFYINLESMFSAGDQHGQAPLLWSAIALLRTDCPGAP
jgi:rhamnogalacturonyl hydrolase YesR